MPPGHPERQFLYPTDSASTEVDQSVLRVTGPYELMTLALQDWKD